jgi:phosphoglycolate phosphatase-like HAD superfamily hydrolase
MTALTPVGTIGPIPASESCVIGDMKYDGAAAREARIPFIGVLSVEFLPRIQSTGNMDFTD